MQNNNQEDVLGL